MVTDPAATAFASLWVTADQAQEGGRFGVTKVKNTAIKLGDHIFKNLAAGFGVQTAL